MSGASASLVVVNPNASRIRNGTARGDVVAQVAAAMQRRDGTVPQVLETRAAGESAPLVAAALSRGTRTVVGVGGDGTLRDIAQALIGSPATLGVVPAGTGNQLASVLDVPLSFDAAAAALVTAVPRAIDLGEVTLRLQDRPATTGLFTIGVGAGFDARLMKTTPHDWKERVGRAAYFAQAIRLASDIGVVPYRLTVDDRIIDVEATLAIVGNLGQLIPGLLGPRLPIVPDDGLLDLIVVGARGPLQGLKGLVDQMVCTSLGGEPGSDSLRMRGRTISVEPQRPEPLDLDGDYVGEGSFLTRVLPHAISVLTPARAS